jgi:hypothetical protein
VLFELVVTLTVPVEVRMPDVAPPGLKVVNGTGQATPGAVRGAYAPSVLTIIVTVPLCSARLSFDRQSGGALSAPRSINAPCARKSRQKSSCLDYPMLDCVWYSSQPYSGSAINYA